LQQRSFLLGGFQVAFPQYNDVVAEGLQGGNGFVVVGYVGGYFVEPPVSTGVGYFVVLAIFVSMPETPVYKNGGVVFWQYNVWLAGQLFGVEAVAEALCMQVAAYQHFGPGVGAADAAHVIASGSGGVYVCHREDKVRRFGVYGLRFGV